MSTENPQINASEDERSKIESSPEKPSVEIAEQMMVDSEKEVSQFSSDSESGLKSAEEKAAADGLEIDQRDKEELDMLDKEARSAQDELAAEITGSGKPHSQAEKIENIKTKACPGCGKENNVGNKFCEGCGNKFEKIENKEEKSIKNICATCGWINNGNENICERCSDKTERRLASDNLKNPETVAEKSEFSEIDMDLARLPVEDPKKYIDYIEEQKNLPPDAMVYLYHGLNGGEYKNILGILDSPAHGIEQRSGPTLSLVPAGQFWKDFGFRYAIRRDQINFPGEKNPNAIIEMTGDENGGTGYIVNESRSLPIDEFSADVMRSPSAKFVEYDSVAEKEVIEKMNDFSKMRSSNGK